MEVYNQKLMTESLKLRKKLMNLSNGLKKQKQKSMKLKKYSDHIKTKMIILDAPSMIVYKKSLDHIP